MKTRKETTTKPSNCTRRLWSYASTPYGCRSQLLSLNKHDIFLQVLLFLCLQQSNETMDQALQTKLKQLARQALDRYADHERLQQSGCVSVP